MARYPAPLAGGQRTLVAAPTSAPAASSFATSTACPARAARCSGAYPSCPGGVRSVSRAGARSAPGGRARPRAVGLLPLGPHTCVPAGDWDETCPVSTGGRGVELLGFRVQWAVGGERRAALTLSLASRSARAAIRLSASATRPASTAVWRSVQGIVPRRSAVCARQKLNLRSYPCAGPHHN